VGAIAWSFTEDGAVDIDRLFVEPAHGRRGHGAALVDTVLGFGRRTIVSTGTANAPARALYDARGFAVVGERTVAPDVTVTRYERAAPYEHDSALRARIAANVAAHDRHVIDGASLRAAVALMLAPVDGIPHFAFTQRAWTLRRGAGQYALPGGTIDPGEDAVAAAVRELEEELGVRLDRSSALGCLDDFSTRTDHVVTPVVLWSDTTVDLRPAADEVNQAWLVPLAELDHPRAPLAVAHPEGGAPILRMPVRGEWINPPTAAFLLQLRDIGLHRRATRVHSVGQPTWTAR
jgi:8-oxo-dGTP pyrophosphatase MutT (NUDIX family)